MNAPHEESKHVDATVEIVHEKTRLRDTTIAISFSAAMVILVGILLAFGVGFWRLQVVQDTSTKNIVANGRKVDQHAALQTAYVNCQAIVQGKKELSAVVDEAFKSSAQTVDLSKLPQTTQTIIAELEPFFAATAASTGDRGAAVRDQIKPAPTCIKPPPLK